MRLNKGSGAVSPIFHSLSLIPLVFLLVELFKDHQYVVFGILVALGITWFGRWAAIGVLIYLFAINSWPEFFLLLGYGFLGWISETFRLTNLKKYRLNPGNIDPFEGVGNALFGNFVYLMLFRSGFQALALITGGVWRIIFWVLFGILLLFEAYRYYYRLGNPWRRIHFPLMVRYSGITGRLMNLKEKTGQEFNIKEALAVLFKSVYPWMSDVEIGLWIDRFEERMDNFCDRDIFLEVLKDKYPTLEESLLEPSLVKIEEIIKTKEPSIFVRYGVAEIVCKEWGELERRKYLYAVLTKKAF